MSPFSKKKPAVAAYTVEKCGSCAKSRRRAYAPGDTLFDGAGGCGCGGEFRVDMIYGEPAGGGARARRS